MQHMLTTTDNPFNPFTEYDAWENYDLSSGYYTAAYLARIASFSSELSDKDQELAIEDAINEIVSENILGIYRKISAPYLTREALENEVPKK